MDINLNNSIIYQQLFSSNPYETIIFFFLPGGNLKPKFLQNLSESLCGLLLCELAVLPEAVCHAK